VQVGTLLEVHRRPAGTQQGTKRARGVEGMGDDSIDKPKGPEVPRSRKALRLGRLLDAHHSATDLIQPPPTGTCDTCHFLMYGPSPDGLKHLPSESEFSRVQNWLEDHLPRWSTPL
jgi:hypothetical protein